MYEDLQRETNAAGLSNLSIWPANLRPSVAIEILRHQLPLPRSTSVITVPVDVAGSRIDLKSYSSQAGLYAAVNSEISQPELAVEYLAANLERGLYRARIEGAQGVLSSRGRVRVVRPGVRGRWRRWAARTGG